MNGTRGWPPATGSRRVTEACYGGALRWSGVARECPVLGDANGGWARVKLDGAPVWIGSTGGTEATPFIKYLEISYKPAGAWSGRRRTGDGGGDDVALPLFAFGVCPVRP